MKFPPNLDVGHILESHSYDSDRRGKSRFPQGFCTDWGIRALAGICYSLGRRGRDEHGRIYYAYDPERSKVKVGSIDFGWDARGRVVTGLYLGEEETAGGDRKFRALWPQ